MKSSRILSLLLFAILLAAPAAYADLSSLNVSLISYWSMNSGLLTDPINGKDLGATGTTVGIGIINDSRQTNTNGDQLQATSFGAATRNNSFSVFGWMWRNNTASQQAVFDSDTSFPRANLWVFPNSSVRCDFGNATASITGVYTIPVPNQTWVMWACVSDQVQRRGLTYINGTLVANFSFTDTAPHASNFNFFRRSDGLDFKGKLDELSWYNRTLTTNEIVSLYNNGVGLTYPFSNGSGPAPAGPIVQTVNVVIPANNLSIIISANATSTNNVTLRYNTTINRSGTLEYLNYSGIFTANLTNQYVNYTVTQEGNYSVCVIADDATAVGLMNCTAFTEITFPTNPPPIMRTISFSISADNRTLIVTGNATDVNNATIRFNTSLNRSGSISQIGFSSFVTSGLSTQYLNISVSQNGNYSVCANANDGANSSTNYVCTDFQEITLGVNNITLQVNNTVNGSLVPGFCVNITGNGSAVICTNATSTSTSGFNGSITFRFYGIGPDTTQAFTTPMAFVTGSGGLRVQADPISAEHYCGQNGTGAVVSYTSSSIAGSVAYWNGLAWTLNLSVAPGVNRIDTLNCLAGGTYFNQTVTQTITATETVTAQTSQAILNMSAYRLFLNNSIAAFNTTNGYVANTTVGGYLTIPANNGSNNVRIDVANNYSLNLTCTVAQPLTVQYCNATGIYDNKFTIGANFEGASVSSFRINVTNTSLNVTNPLYSDTTSTGSLVFNLLQGYYYTFSFFSEGYALTNTTQLSNANTSLYNFSLLTSNILNLTFYDEQTGLIITLANISLDVIGQQYPGRNYSTNNGTIQTGTLPPDTYTLRYYGINNTGSHNYSTRFWYVTLENNTQISLRLPMLRETVAQLVTVTTVTSTSIPIANLTVKAYKYDSTTGVYVLNQMIVTNTEGQGVFSMQLGTEFYYFTVENATAVLLTTVPSYIYSNTIEPFVIDVLPGGFNNLFNAANIVGAITFNNVTSTATFTYVDSDNTATQGCLYAYFFNITGKRLYSSLCANTSSGSIPITIVPNGTWEFQGIVTKNGVQNIVASYTKTYNPPPSGESTNMMGLFALLLVICVFVFVFRDKPPVMVAVVGALPLVFSIIDFIAIGVVYTLPIALAGGILALFLGRSQPSA